MAKLSVYVPDELLAEAKQADPEVRLSALLQDALRSRLVDRGSRPYAQLDDRLTREREAAQRLITDRVADAWRAGYATGLEFAKSLPWEAFEAFAARRWDVKAWRLTFDETEYRIADPSSAAEAESVLDFGSLMDWVEERLPAIPTDAHDTPIGVSGEGFTDAIRDVWEGARSIRAGAVSDSGASGAPVQAEADDVDPA